MMNDWVVESPSFEEQLMNNKIVMLNQNGINKVVEIIKQKDKEIERLNKENKELNKICARKSHYIDKKDLEIGELNYIIDEIKERVLDETKPLPSAKEIIDIIGDDK